MNGKYFDIGRLKEGGARAFDKKVSVFDRANILVKWVLILKEKGSVRCVLNC